MSLSAEQRRALELLAGGPRGYTKGRLLADGFTVDMLADLAACRTQVSVFVRADNSITRGDDRRIHGGCP